MWSDLSVCRISKLLYLAVGNGNIKELFEFDKKTVCLLIRILMGHCAIDAAVLLQKLPCCGPNGIVAIPFMRVS